MPNLNIPCETWRRIKETIQTYPYDYTDWVRSEGEIIHGATFKELTGSAGYISDPTAAKALKLTSDKRDAQQRKCLIINHCINTLAAEHSKVVCFYFWGVCSTDKAIRAVMHGERLYSMKYADVSREVGYCERQAKKIVGRVIAKIGGELGYSQKTGQEVMRCSE